MKVPKSAFYMSLLISTILAVIIYAGIPFVIAGLIIILFNLSNIWVGPLMVAIYIFMREWSELKRTAAMSKTKVDFAALLDLNAPPKVEVIPDRSKYRKTKREKVDFGIPLNPMTNVVVKETVFNPNDYKVECGDLSLYCAAMFGGPLY